MSLLNEYISKRMGGKELEAELRRLKEGTVLITFLKRTKDGEYAKIDKSLLAYTRVKEQREPNYNDEEYYYGIR